MSIKIPPAYKPLVIAIVIAGLAYGVYVAEAIFGEQAVEDCCAPEA